MERLLIQLKQRVPLNRIDYGGLESGCPLSDLEQSALLKVLCEIGETNRYYSFHVLKKVLGLLEKSGDGVQEEFYDMLSEWVVLTPKPLQPTDEDRVVYTFVDEKKQAFELVVNETPNVISGLGTTGLRTWEAALYLAQYLAVRPELLGPAGDVLELGCGTGLVGMSVLRRWQRAAAGGDGRACLQGRRVLITDGDSQLLEKVQSSLRCNGLDACRGHRIEPLWWGRDPVPAGVTTVLAADVTYDATAIPYLVETLERSMQRGHGQVQRVFVAATERNETTLGVWEDEISRVGVWEWRRLAEIETGAAPGGGSEIQLPGGGSGGETPLDTLVFPTNSHIIIYLLERREGRECFAPSAS